MEIDSRDFLNTPPVKTVRFGCSVAETLSKHKQVSRNVLTVCFYLIKTRLFKRCSCCLKGDLGDYELLKHQLADPDIKVQSSLSGFKVTWDLCNSSMIGGLYLSELSPVTGCSDHQLAARISDVCDPADQGPWTAHLQCLGEYGKTRFLFSCRRTNHYLYHAKSWND